MFLAAFTSSSCMTPQREQHRHSVTPSALSPLGPVRVSQAEQVTLENIAQPDTLSFDAYLRLSGEDRRTVNLRRLQIAGHVTVANGRDLDCLTVVGKNNRFALHTP